MTRKIIAGGVVDLRAAPDRDAERVSQTLMGRIVLVHEAREGWSRVETDDTYTGWLESRRLADPTPGQPLTPIRVVFADVREGPDARTPLVLRLPILSAVLVDPTRRVGEGWLHCTLPDGREGWLPEPVFRAPDAPELPVGRVPARRRQSASDAVERSAQIAGRAAAYAHEFLGTPYLWGGSSAFGLDCSGYVQLAYRLAGVVLRRDAHLQRDDPRFVPVEREQLAPGDLVFFGQSSNGDSPGRITHVGLHFGEGAFLHAASGAGVVLTPWKDARPDYVDARRLARAAEPITRH